MKLKTIEKKIILHGYEYTLVENEGSSRKIANYREPCAFGHEGFALHSCKKIKKI